MVLGSPSKPPCTLPFCQFCTKPTRWSRFRRNRSRGGAGVMGCGDCGARSRLTNACPIYCQLCHQSNHHTAWHRCFYCGKLGQHKARHCPDALYYMCQIENLKAVRRLRWPFHRGCYRFDTRCLDVSIDFNNYELYQMIIDSQDLSPREILRVAVERGATEWMMSILRSSELTSEDLSSSVGHQLILSAFNDDREDLALSWLAAGGDPNMVVNGWSLLQHAESIYFEAFTKALIDAGASTNNPVGTNINDGIESVVGEVGLEDDIPYLTEVTEVPSEEISSDSDDIDTD